MRDAKAETYLQTSDLRPFNFYCHLPIIYAFVRLVYAFPQIG